MSQYVWDQAYVGPDLSFKDAYAEVLPPAEEEFHTEREETHEAEVEAAETWEEELATVEPPPIPAPVLTELIPAEAVIGSADLLLSVVGTDFAPGAVIVFNGGDEPTTFVNSTEVTTWVKPSTAGVAGPLPILVRNPDGQETTPLDFTFTEAETP